MRFVSRTAWSSGLRVGLLSAVALTSMVALPLSGAFAQEATAVAVTEISVDPATCTTEGISTDHAAELLSTPVATPELPLTDAGIVALPEGVPSTEAELAPVLVTLEQLWSCNNARDKAKVYANFTDQALQETMGFTEGSSWDQAELRADVAAALTPGEPRTPEEWATINAIVSATTYEDGQIGLLILNTDPFVANGNEVQDYFKFVIEDGVAKVSQVILDPYDLTPIYGFNKAA